MEKDDDRLYLPKRLCAMAFGISVQAFSNWNVAPVRKEGREQLYDLREVIEYKLRKERGEDDEFGEGAGWKEKARLDRARADMVELELEIKRGQMVSVEALRPRLIDMVMAFRAKILNLPKRLGQDFNSFENGRECEARAEEIVQEALNELSEYEPDISESDADTGPEGPDSVGRSSRGPSSKADGESVGGRASRSKRRRQRGAGEVQDIES
jgi:phage terminase Nu1 subunit (DNA packaging protein)